jgi:hypothetical protein
MNGKRLHVWLMAGLALLSAASCTLAFGDFTLAPTTETGGAVGTAGTAGTGGSTCEAGAASCRTPTDCPLPPGGCVQSACEAGCCTTTNVAEDSPCNTYKTNMSGFCDGVGNCVQCTKASECPGITNDCRQPACTIFSCTTAFTAVNTPTMGNPPQTTEACHQTVCNGMGGTSIVDADNPVDSGTVCITNTCTNGTAGQTIHAGKMCGGTPSMPETCSMSGQCGCMSNADCTPPDTCGGGNPGMPLYCGCTPNATTCTSPKLTTCGNVSNGCSTINCNDGKKDGTETDVDCGGGNTANSTCSESCPQGDNCNVNADCKSGICAFGICG